MAKLAAFQRDPKTLTEGVWITPNERDHPEIRLRVKARDQGFHDQMSIRWRELVRQARQDGRLKPRQGFGDLPPSATVGVENELLLGLVLDVDGIEGDRAKLTVAEFRVLAMQEEYRPLLDLAREAVDLATERRAADREAAEGNSAPGSRTASSGAAPQP